MTVRASHRDAPDTPGRDLPPRADRRGDHLRRGRSILVFPHAKCHPARRMQPVGRPLITLAVRGQLVAPEIAIGLWQHPVHRTPVPEASIDVDRYAARREHNVGSRPKAINRYAIDPKSKPAGVKLATKGHLRLGIACPDPGHTRRDCRIGGLR